VMKVLKSNTDLDEPEYRELELGTVAAEHMNVVEEDCPSDNQASNENYILLDGLCKQETTTLDELNNIRNQTKLDSINNSGEIKDHWGQVETPATVVLVMRETLKREKQTFVFPKYFELSKKLKEAFKKQTQKFGGFF
ncbi:hypothetical protein GWI33_013073, partial [Rhynchophorus ferrugineus]